MGKMVATGFLSTFVGRKVMVTGHTGFKGAWLTFLLKEIGANVLGYALPPDSEDNLFSRLGLDSSITHKLGDIRNLTKLKSVMEAFQPEFVFHLAAQAIVRESYSDPHRTFETNIMGSVNVLEAIRGCPSIRVLVYVTSDKCYENVEWVWGYREIDRLGGRDPYSASKAAAEMVFAAYSDSFFKQRPELGASTVRAGNVLGGGDWSVDRIVPDCIRSILSNQSIRLRNPHATRPWQHVLEPIGGYLLLASKLRESPSDYSGSWNFGPSCLEVKTVLEVAELIVKGFGRGQIEVESADNQKHEAQMLQLNCDKANQVLGWFPRWNFTTTMEATTEWYKKALATPDACSITRSQLLDYFPELT